MSDIESLQKELNQISYRSDHGAPPGPVITEILPPDERPVLKYGSGFGGKWTEINNWVAYLQTKLKQLGYNPGRVDGKFGSATKSAVQLFQADSSLIADGIVGLNTWTALSSKLPIEPLEVYIYGEDKSSLEQVRQQYPHHRIVDAKKRLIYPPLEPSIPSIPSPVPTTIPSYIPEEEVTPVPDFLKKLLEAVKGVPWWLWASVGILILVLIATPGEKKETA